MKRQQNSERAAEGSSAARAGGGAAGPGDAPGGGAGMRQNRGKRAEMSRVLRRGAAAGAALPLWSRPGTGQRRNRLNESKLQINAAKSWDFQLGVS